MHTQAIDDRLLVSDALNNTHSQNDSKQRVALLAQVEEVLLNKQPILLDEFLKKVLEFHLDTSSSVKCFLASFIQKVAQNSSQNVTLTNLKDCVETLLFLYNDGSPKVLKSVIASITVAYMRSLLLICKTPINPQNQTDCTKLWSILTQLRRRMGECLDSEHDGVRTHALHFFEYLVVAFSLPPTAPIVVATRKGSKFTVKQSDDTFDLSVIPQKHPLLDADKLRREGEQYFGLLLARASSLDIKFGNISVIQQCLFNVAKQRSQWWDKIIPLLCNQSLPQNLTSSQQISLRFSQRSILLYLLKMPAMKQFRTIIVATLKKLETKSDAIDSAIRYADRANSAPSSKSKESQDSGKPVKDKKRKMSESEEAPKKKKHRPDIEVTGTIPPLSILFDTQIGKFNAIDLANIVVDGFLAANVHPKDSNHQLSFVSFANILMNMTADLDKNDSLEIQSFISEPLPPKAPESGSAIKDPRLVDPRLAAETQDGIKMEEEDEAPEPQVIIQRRVQTEQEIEEKKVARQITNLNKDFKSKSKPLTDKERKFLLNVGWERILSSETDINREGKQNLRTSLLVKMVSTKVETSEWYTQLLQHIRGDVKGRIDLALQWLYQEFSNCCIKHHKNNQKKKVVKKEEEEQEPSADIDAMKTEDGDSLNGTQPIDYTRYENLLHTLLDYAKEELEPNDMVFSRYFVQAPRLTAKSLEVVREYALDPNRVTLGLITLRDIILRREPVRETCLSFLLDFSFHENSSVRSPAVRVLTDQLFPIPLFTEKIEKFATSKLNELLKPETWERIKHIAEQKRQEEQEELKQKMEDEAEEQQSDKKPETKSLTDFESEETRRYCTLYSSLCTQRGEMLNNFISVYTALKDIPDNQEPKKTVLEELNSLVRILGPLSPHVLHYLRSFPDELESLALGFVDTLIASSEQSATPVPQELIGTIKSIFFMRTQKNPRFLLPVMVSLTKEEVNSALEQILTLDNDLLKVAIHRLILANYGGMRKDQMSPEELLVALHKLDNTQDQQSLMKIAFATTLCFGKPYRQIFSKNSLAIVLQQLIELPSLPQLLMRTMIQTLKTCPDLVGFIANLMIRLIKKRIWDNRTLWRGFVKCLDEMKDISIHHVHDILCQLPSSQNRDIFTDKNNANMKERLRMHIISTQPRNSSDQLLKHLGFKYHPETGDIVTLSREETERVAKEADNDGQ